MKLNISILSFLLACTFFSCSSDDTPGVEVPERVYDATLSLVIKDKGKNQKTKATVDYNASNVKSAISYFVNNLSLAVFDTEGLVAFEEVQAELVKGKYESALNIKDVNIPSGNLKVLVLANVIVPEDLKAMNTSIDQYKLLSGDLDGEKNGYLTMSSGILAYSAAAGKNYIGFESDAVTDGVIIDTKPIELVRMVADVYLEYLKLDPSDNYKSQLTTFTLKKIFVANVKKSSLLVSDESWGAVEKLDAGWWSGNTSMNGSLDAKNSEEKSFFCYDLENAPEDKAAYNKTYPYLNGIWDLSLDNGGDILGKNGSVSLKKPSEASHLGYSYFPLGVNFYVYENMQSEYHTLLVVQGDYTYTPEGESLPITLEDRFYTVVINKDGKSTIFNADLNVTKTEDVGHQYVRRNYKYAIFLTVAGPGSDNPYNIQASTHISAQVTVRNWDVVNMEEEVD